MNQPFRMIVRRDDIISECYTALREPLCRYVASRVGNAADAEDMAQEVFVRLLEYNALLTPETLPRFIWRIARNLITDYFRRHACRKSAAEYFAQFAPVSARNTEEEIAAAEVLHIEHEVVARMPRRKARVYGLYVRECRSSDEIAADLGISRRTVENHIFSARCELRKALADAI